MRLLAPIFFLLVFVSHPPTLCCFLLFHIPNSAMHSSWEFDFFHPGKQKKGEKRDDIKKCEKFSTESERMLSSLLVSFFLFYFFFLEKVRAGKKWENRHWPIELDGLIQYSACILQRKAHDAICRHKSYWLFLQTFPIFASNYFQAINKQQQ